MTVGEKREIRKDDKLYSRYWHTMKQQNFLHIQCDPMALVSMDHHPIPDLIQWIAEKPEGLRLK